MAKYIDADRLLAGIYSDNPKDVMLYIANFPAADVAPRFIPFTTRPCTEEEKEEHPGLAGYLDCQLPDDGDRILITTKSGYVCEDEMCCDGDYWYLASGYGLGDEAIAWMPLPDPYKEDK